MAFYRICALFLLFNIQSFSSTLLKSLVTRQFPDGLPINVKDNHEWLSYKLGTDKLEDMMMDAAAETSRKCIPYVRCGFQPFDDEETLRLELDHSHPFVPYCKCPEGEECKAAGVNTDAHYIYYKCFPQDEVYATEGQDETTTASVETVNSEATVKLQTEMSSSSLEPDSEGTVKPLTEMPSSSMEPDSEGTVKPETEMSSSSMEPDSEDTVKPQTEMSSSSMVTDSETTFEPQTEIPPSSIQTDSEDTVKPQTELPTPSVETYSDVVEIMENTETIDASPADSTSRYGFIANRNEL